MTRLDNALVGLDLQSMEEVESSLMKYGYRYIQRLFTHRESELCLRTPLLSASNFAGRFAAKEAVLKILDPRELVPLWKEIEVIDMTSGRAEPVLHGTAAHLARERDIVHVSVSVCCAGGYAMATAIAHVNSRQYR